MNLEPFNLLSIGTAAQAVQLSPRRVAELAESLKIAPVGFINGVAHYDARDIERIVAHVATVERPPIPAANLHPFF